MRRMLLEYLAERGPRIFSVWLPFAVPNDREERAPEVCPACRLNHNRLTTLEASVDVCDGLRRRLSFCPRCGIIEDAPFGSDAKLSVGAAQDLHLQYLNAFGKPWAGVLVVRSQIAGDRMVWRWPADADGQVMPTEAVHAS